MKPQRTRPSGTPDSSQQSDSTLSGTQKLPEIVFINHSGNFSGAEKVLLDLIFEALDRGHPVTVMCPTGPLSTSLPTEVRWVAIPVLGGIGPGALGKLRAPVSVLARWLRAAAILRQHVRHSPDARIVVNSLMATPMLRFAKLTGSWLVHDTVRARKQRFALQLAGRAVHHAVAVSELTAESLRNTGYAVTVRYNGVDIPEVVSRTLSDRPIVGILASLTPWKGHRTLLAAIAQLPQVQLEIAGRAFPGDEWYEAELRERANQPDLAGRVTFLGHVSPSDAIGRWDIGVNCSELPEAGPISVLEMLAAGIPMVVTPRTSYTFSGICVLVEPDNADAIAVGISTLLAEPERQRQDRIDAGRQAVADSHNRAETIPMMLDSLLHVGNCEH